VENNLTSTVVIVINFFKVRLYKVIVNKILSGANTRGLKLISPDGFEDEYSGELRRRYCKFKELLDHNRQSPKGKGKRLTIKQMEDIVGISKSSYYRLRDRIESGEKIIRKSKRPKSTRKSKVSQEIKQKIKKIRLDNPCYGKDKIRAILIREHNIIIGSSTIGKTIRELKKKI
jgi:transposase